MNKEELEKKNVLELKGMLFDIQQQIGQLQKHANEVIAPVLQEKLKEENKDKE